MKFAKKTIRDLNLNNKKVILRLDLNVPMQDGTITDVTRITQSLPTINYLLDKGCKLIILSHLSRIKSLDDKMSGKKSLQTVANVLQEFLPNNKIYFSDENYGPTVRKKVDALSYGEILLLENTRYLDVDADGEMVKWESKNKPELGLFWASLADVFVNDAFGIAHRAHASNVGIAANAKESAIGFLIERELLNLEKACEHFERPLVAVLGGAKVSDKLRLIKNIIPKTDYLLICGGMAYTFRKALGFEVGTSLIDETMLEPCKQLVTEYPDKIILPVDNLVHSEFKDEVGVVAKVDETDKWKGKMGLDIGPKTIELFNRYLDGAKTVFWNGPAGVFEMHNYRQGTYSIAKKLVEITQTNAAFTLIGGGDSAAAFHQLIGNGEVSFISTGGGASLAYMEGSELPGISAVQDLK